MASVGDGMAISSGTITTFGIGDAKNGGLAVWQALMARLLYALLYYVTSRHQNWTMS